MKVKDIKKSYSVLRAIQIAPAAIVSIIFLTLLDLHSSFAFDNFQLNSDSKTLHK